MDQDREQVACERAALETLDLNEQQQLVLAWLNQPKHLEMAS